MHLPEVRAAIRERAPTALEQLSEAIPETYLLTEDLLPKLLAEQSLWILKFAGFTAVYEDNDKKKEKDVILPDVAVGEQMELKKILTEQ